jgi:phage replication-related protein YjqB (UPF0714/DUF867 family)
MLQTPLFSKIFNLTCLGFVALGVLGESPASIFEESNCGSYLELSQQFKLDRDYFISVLDRQSDGTVLAVHGGWIEFGTSEIAKTIADEDFNLYLLEGYMPEGNAKLHVISSLFDEPQAVELVTRSRWAVSIHGYAGDEKKQICMGGANLDLQKAVFQSLLATGLLEQTVANPCDRFWARDPENIVNRAQESGVQIEISRALRESLLLNSGQLEEFSRAIRSGLFKSDSERVSQ